MGELAVGEVAGVVGAGGVVVRGERFLLWER